MSTNNPAVIRSIMKKLQYKIRSGEFEGGQHISYEIIDQTEQEIGVSFPPLLRELYCGVCNGGTGETGGKFEFLRCNGDHSVASAYIQRRRRGNWPESLLPFWHWGRGFYTCVMAGGSEELWMLDPDRTEFRTRYTLDVVYDRALFRYDKNLFGFFLSFLDGIDNWSEMYFKDGPIGFGRWDEKPPHQT